MGRFIAETKTQDEITLILAMEGNKETLRQLSGASDSLKYICGYEDSQAEDVIKLLGRMLVTAAWWSHADAGGSRRKPAAPPPRGARAGEAGRKTKSSSHPGLWGTARAHP